MSVALSQNPEMRLALGAARAAGKLLLKGASEFTPEQISYKSSIDLVTDCDRQSEELIIKALEPSQIPVFAEESQLFSLHDHIMQKKSCWIVDPLDGTTNFAHGFPHYSISIALMLNGALTLGTVFNPNTQEMFLAQKGLGAWCNEKPLKSQDCSLEHALILTGFPYDRRAKSSFYLEYFEHFLKQCQGIRRPGSAALDLAYVAAGRANGFWEFGLQPWDVAAGILLAEESGAIVSDFYGAPCTLHASHFLAASPSLHSEMLEQLKKLEPHECQT